MRERAQHRGRAHLPGEGAADERVPAAFTAGPEKPIYRTEDLQWHRLLALDPPAPVPSWEQFERYFQRVWLDDLMSWTQQQVNPNENQPNYGREASRMVSIAALMVQLDEPGRAKRSWSSAWSSAASTCRDWPRSAGAGTRAAATAAGASGRSSSPA